MTLVLTRLRAFASRQGLEISLFSTTSRVPHTPGVLFSGHRVLFPRTQSGRFMKLIIHLHPVLKLQTRVTVPPPPEVFMAWCLIKHRGKFTPALQWRYCGIFAESQDTLLGNGATNVSPRQRWCQSTMKQLREAVFSTGSDARRTVTLQWNTSHYGAYMNRKTARSVCCTVHPEAASGESEPMLC
jgi:hypothetical protein